MKNLQQIRTMEQCRKHHIRLPSLVQLKIQEASKSDLQRDINGPLKNEV